MDDFIEDLLPWIAHGVICSIAIDPFLNYLFLHDLEIG
jgi:hypothetical protein